MSISTEERRQIVEQARARAAARATHVPAPAPEPNTTSVAPNPSSAPPLVRPGKDTVIRVIDENNPPTVVQRRGNVVQRPAGPQQHGARTMGAKIAPPKAPGPRVRQQAQHGAYGATIVSGPPQAPNPAALPVRPSPGSPAAPPVPPQDLAAQIQSIAAAQASGGTPVAPVDVGAALGIVTVVMSQHVRPDTMEHQYRALHASGIGDANIRCWVNPAGVRLNDGLIGKVLSVKASHDMGPWMRWTLATASNTKYVLVIDDDCIPGPKWIRNAIARLEAAERDGETIVVAAAGSVYASDQHDTVEMYGPESMHREEIIVDTGRGAWMMDIDLARMIDAFPKVGSPLATSLHVSAAVQNAGGLVVVLPYPHNSREDWGMLEGPRAVGSMSARVDQIARAGHGPSSDQFRKADYEVYRQHWDPLCVLQATSTELDQVEDGGLGDDDDEDQDQDR